MLQALAALFREAARYARACPWLFLVPVAAEAARHVAEGELGFYGGMAAAHGLAASPLRLAFGTAKVLALLWAGYWVTRWLEWGDPRRTRGVEPAALRSFAPLLLLELAAGLPAIWREPIEAALGVAVPGRVVAALEVASFALTLLFADWNRTAPLGERGGPWLSARRVAPLFGWALAFTLLAVIPPMAVHYALNYAAMAAPGGLKPALLAADTLWVGYLGVVVNGTPWFVSERARARRSAA